MLNIWLKCISYIRMWPLRKKKTLPWTAVSTCVHWEATCIFKNLRTLFPHQDTAYIFRAQVQICRWACSAHPSYASANTSSAHNEATQLPFEAPATSYFLPAYWAALCRASSMPPDYCGRRSGHILLCIWLHGSRIAGNLGTEEMHSVKEMSDE